MPTNFLQATGGSTVGYFSAVTTLISSEMVSIGSSLTMVSASTFTSSGSFGQAIWGEVYFYTSATFAPVAGGYLSGWFLRSPNGGTTFESTTGSSGIAIGRAPDFTIPFSTVSYASSDVIGGSGLVRMPWSPSRVFIMNNSGATMPASNSTNYPAIKLGPVAVQY
jgi:hypothetical protein